MLLRTLGRLGRLGRLGAVAVLVIGLLATSAAPASATAHNIAITGSSTKVFHGAGSTQFHVHYGDHPTTNVCAPNSQQGMSVLGVDFKSTGGGTIGGGMTGYMDLIVGNNAFKVRWVIVSGTVTLTTTTISMTLVMYAEFRNCASTTLLCKTNNLTVTMTGTNGSGSLHPGVSSPFTVSGTSTLVTVAAVPSCNVIIRAAVLNSTMNASLNLHVIT